MTIGEKIKNIRKEEGLTQKELAAGTGIDDATIRKYESGKLNPKPATLAKIAKGLGVDVNVLSEAELDAPKAMLKLFSVFNSYDGVLIKGKDLKKEIKKKDFNDNDIYISFKLLQAFLSSWYDQYEKYRDAVKKAESIKDPEYKEQYLTQAKKVFDYWMNQYPETEPAQSMLYFYEVMEEASAFMAAHPLNDPENPVTPAEKELYEKELKSIYAKLRPGSRQ